MEKHKFYVNWAGSSIAEIETDDPEGFGRHDITAEQAGEFFSEADLRVDDVEHAETCECWDSPAAYADTEEVRI